MQIKHIIIKIEGGLTLPHKCTGNYSSCIKTVEQMFDSFDGSYKHNFVPTQYSMKTFLPPFVGSMSIILLISALVAGALPFELHGGPLPFGNERPR